ncbi:hypothetical protein TcCL_NonESM08272 [Trypanosoma cruzi]|nr:hypothetical protein TcCL_NonESM08272 [Trypanosoma cruzi]
MHHRSVPKFKKQQNSSHRHQSRPHHAAVSRGWAQELWRSITPCGPFWLDASTVRCTTAAKTSLRVWSHSPPQPGSAARRQLHGIARPTRIIEGYFCPPGRQSSTAAEDRRFPGTTEHERLTILRYIEDVRGATCLETAPSSILGKAATSILLPGDAVLKELRRVCGHMEISRATSTPLMLGSALLP